MRTDKTLVKAKDFEVGKIYGGAPVGEFQMCHEKRVWWKRADGKIQEVKPHPDSIFFTLLERYRNDFICCKNEI